MKFPMLLPILALVIISGCSSESKLSYSDNKFSFDYGKNLEIIAIEKRPIFVEQTEPEENIVSLWPVGEYDVNILVKKELKTKQEMERITGSEINNIGDYEAILKKITGESGITQVSSKQFDVLGFKGAEMLFEFEKGGKQIKSRSITFFRNDVPYTIEHTSSKEKFSKYQKEFDGIVSSLKLA